MYFIRTEKNTPINLELVTNFFKHKQDGKYCIIFVYDSIATDTTNGFIGHHDIWTFDTEKERDRIYNSLILTHCTLIS